VTLAFVREGQSCYRPVSQRNATQRNANSLSFTNYHSKQSVATGCGLANTRKYDDKSYSSIKKALP
jgi:hypothetical protein